MFMTHTLRPNSRISTGKRHIVSAIAAGMLSIGALTYSTAAFAQTHDVKMQTSEQPAASDTKYDLPKQKLTYQITAYQIISDMALTRGQLKTAYQGYMLLANKTRDPRYAERAYVVAALADDPASALLAAKVLKALAPNATLGDTLLEQTTLNSILSKSEAGQVQQAFAETKEFLAKHPNHEIALTLLSDLAVKLGKDEDQLYAWEQLYKLTPNNAEAMNNLGYYLADHNIRLDEADQLIKGALKISPNAPHIIDSAAWLAYRQGKLTEALKLSRSAVAAAANPDVKLHLAEILWANNQRDEARQLFNELKAEIKSSDALLFKQLNQTIQRLGVE